MVHISIHALLAESDPPLADGAQPDAAFLSTLSLRRATPAVPLVSGATRISIHALLAESDVVHLAQAASPGGISIHALLAESDAVAVVGATQPGDISIHALLAESDTMWTAAIWYTSISIHALLAESDAEKLNNSLTIKLFLSTLSLRRATGPSSGINCKTAISIHALLAESDQTGSGFNFRGIDFYPRSPCGERQRAEHHANSQQEFLSTLSLRRATLTALNNINSSVFLSTLSLRRATMISLLVSTSC